MALHKPSFLCACLLAVCLLAQPDHPRMSWDTGMYHQDPQPVAPAAGTVVSWQPRAFAPSRTALLGQPTSHNQLRNKDQDTPVQLRTLGGYSGSRAPRLVETVTGVASWLNLSFCPLCFHPFVFIGVDPTGCPQ